MCTSRYNLLERRFDSTGTSASSVRRRSPPNFRSGSSNRRPDHVRWSRRSRVTSYPLPVAASGSRPFGKPRRCTSAGDVERCAGVWGGDWNRGRRRVATLRNRKSSDSSAMRVGCWCCRGIHRDAGCASILLHCSSSRQWQHRTTGTNPGSAVAAAAGRTRSRYNRGGRRGTAPSEFWSHPRGRSCSPGDRIGRLPTHLEAEMTSGLASPCGKACDDVCRTKTRKTNSRKVQKFLIIRGDVRKMRILTQLNIYVLLHSTDGDMHADKFIRTSGVPRSAYQQCHSNCRILLVQLVLVAAMDTAVSVAAAPPAACQSCIAMPEANLRWSGAEANFMFAQFRQLIIDFWWFQ